MPALSTNGYGGYLHVSAYTCSCVNLRVRGFLPYLSCHAETSLGAACTDCMQHTHRCTRAPKRTCMLMSAGRCSPRITIRGWHKLHDTCMGCKCHSELSHSLAVHNRRYLTQPPRSKGTRCQPTPRLRQVQPAGLGFPSLPAR